MPSRSPLQDSRSLFEAQRRDAYPCPLCDTIYLTYVHWLHCYERCHEIQALREESQQFQLQLRDSLERIDALGTISRYLPMYTLEEETFPSNAGNVGHQGEHISPVRAAQIIAHIVATQGQHGQAPHPSHGRETSQVPQGTAI